MLAGYSVKCVPVLNALESFCICIAHAKSFRVHDFVLKHDCDRETGYRVLINLLLRQFLDFLNSVHHLLGGDMRLLCWRRRRYFKDERCDAGKNNQAEDSHRVIFAGSGGQLETKRWQRQTGTATGKQLPMGN